MNNNFNDKTLTQRETETLTLITKGFCNRQIADELCISVHTVKAHIESLYDKFGTHNKVEAVVHAIKFGLLNLDDI